MLDASFERLDALLRRWHVATAARAAARRDQVVDAMASAVAARDSRWSGDHDEITAPRGSARRADRLGILANLTNRPYLRAAACLALVAGVVALLVPVSGQAASACDRIVMAPEGGRLDAIDPQGNALGPCDLRQTDVDVDISGPFSRVTVKQTYANVHPFKIEAVYTFPLSHRASVDRMIMTVGDRVVVGEVKERAAARRMYEQARASGYVASLLEQARPNIFTQSIANIEPGATVVVEISYVEMLERRDGEFRFEFPMVVGPRYIPGYPARGAGEGMLPNGFAPRPGLVLLGPASIEARDAAVAAKGGVVDVAPGAAPMLVADAAPPTIEDVRSRVERAAPVSTPAASWWNAARVGTIVRVAAFTVGYANGSKELGELYSDGSGQVNGRWFFAGATPAAGTGFAAATAQVPDAGRITPMPVRPPSRAGHDVSMRVRLDSGGAAIRDVRSTLHEVTTQLDGRDASVELRRKREIPNRDFILSWRTDATAIEDGVFAFADERNGGFVTVVLAPPSRVDSGAVRARELVFVLDTSGSMSGFPIEKAKQVMAKAIDAMRPGDTFNVITFAGDTHVLWPDPRSATADNRAAAQAFLASRAGGGGTEMMEAIDTALRPSAPAQPPVDVQSLAVGDGRLLARDSAPPMRICMFLTDGFVGNDQAIIDAVRRNAGTTRVFSFGIGNSVNRWLLEQMAMAGRGVSDIVTLEGGADEAVERFTRRIENPVLTDIQVSTQGVTLTDVVAGSPSTSPALLPDLYDVDPIVLHARYTKGGRGAITIRGRTGQGPWERTVALDLPERSNASSGASATATRHASLPALWARSKVEQVLAPHLAALQQGAVDPAVRAEVVTFGERFGIMTPFTSFVAVEKARMTLGGGPVLVAIPIELPQGLRWDGFFGECAPWAAPGLARERLLELQRRIGDGRMQPMQPGWFNGAPEFDLDGAISFSDAISVGGDVATRAQFQLLFDACGTDVNGGSNTIVGTAWADGGVREAEWYGYGADSLGREMLLNTNNTALHLGLAVDPSFQQADFFGVDGTPLDAITFDSPSGGLVAAGQAVAGVPFANSLGTGYLFGTTGAPSEGGWQDRQWTPTSDDAGAFVLVEVNADGTIIAPVPVTIDVGPLLEVAGGGDTNSAELTALLQGLVAPGTWDLQGGGTGSIRIADGIATIVHVSGVRDRVTHLIDQLCAAMELPIPASRETAARSAQRLGGGAGAMAMIDVAYDVADLLAATRHAAPTTASPSPIPAPRQGASAHAALAGLLSSSVDPPSWRPAGAGEIHAFGPLLVIRQSPANHLRIAASLEALRQGFGLPSKPISMTTEARSACDALIAQERERGAALERLGTLRQRLDDVLFACVVEIENPGAQLVNRTAVTSRLAGRMLPPRDGDVNVSVLLRAPASGETLKAVARSGLTIESRQDRLGLVVGRISARRLAELALVDGVRRIEMLDPR